MTDNTPCCIRACVSGRVQGVYYRAFTRERALAAGLTGRAVNLADGRVEVILQGPRQAIEAVLAALREGPTLAEVSDIVTEPLPLRTLTGFTTG